MHTKMPLNVRNRVVSPTGIAERTASLEIRLKLQLASGLRGGRIGERVILIPCSSRAIPCSPISNSLFGHLKFPVRSSQIPCYFGTGNCHLTICEPPRVFRRLF